MFTCNCFSRKTLFRMNKLKGNIGKYQSLILTKLKYNVALIKILYTYSSLSAMLNYFQSWDCKIYFDEYGQIFPIFRERSRKLMKPIHLND